MTLIWRLVLCALCWQAAAGTECDTDNGWLPFQGSCYFVSNSAELSSYSWQAARRHCLLQGGELASVHSKAELQFIIGLADQNDYEGPLWTGLNQLRDRDKEFEWSDGSALDFQAWAPNQPSRNGLEKCIYTRTTPDTYCFERYQHMSLVDGVISRPTTPPVGCRRFGYFPEDGIARCEQACGAYPECDGYSYFERHSNMTWSGECLGCKESKLTKPKKNEHAFSGMRKDCPPLDADTWYSDNCGEKKAFVCKKDPNADGPATVAPTPEVPGYCPKGYWGFGNKCYKLVSYNFPKGVTWGEALDKCRSEPGIQADLASLSSPEEQAAVTAQLTEHSWAYWIGYTKSAGHDWVWTDNDDPSYTNWAKDASKYSNCAVVRTHPGRRGSWTTLGCNDKRGYICETFKDPAHVESTPGVKPPQECPEGFAPYVYGCYKLQTEPQTWSTAERMCTEMDGHIASIHDESENAFIFGIGQHDLPMWIGLEKIDNEYVWSDGWPDIYTNWGKNEPGGGDGCVAMATTGQWNDTQCHNEFSYVCKIAKVNMPTTPAPIPGICPSEDWEEFGSHCFLFATSYQSWAGAESMCNLKAGDDYVGHLAHISNRVYNDWIFSKLQDKLQSDAAWIGLSREDLDSPWEWSDNAAATYSNWAPGEPNGEAGRNELCVEMYLKAWPGLWNDNSCYRSRPAVCMTEKAPLPSTPSQPAPEPGVCPSEDWVPRGGDCFLFRPDAFLGWEEASEECGKLPGATLATLETDEENWFVWKGLDAVSIMPVFRGSWIGLAQMSAETGFEWEDDSASEYRKWAEGQPVEEARLCVELTMETGEWAASTCSLDRGYVCKVRKDTSGVTSPAPDRPVTPSSDATSKPTDDQLAAGAIVGIVVGVLLLVAVLGAAGYFSFVYFVQRRRLQDILGFSNETYSGSNDA